MKQVQQRLSTVEQLDGVMQAMNGIASSHLHDAQAYLQGIRSYSETIGLAIAKVLLTLNDSMKTHHGLEGVGMPQRLVSYSESSSRGNLILVLCAEQGFAGAFSERVLDGLRAFQNAGDALGQDFSADKILLVGSRGQMVAETRGIQMAHGFPMVTSAEAVSSLAIAVSEVLFDQVSEGHCKAVQLFYSEQTDKSDIAIVHRELIPFDFSRFRSFSRTALHMPPLLTKSPVLLASQLAEEYVFAEISDALMCSYAAENAARVQSMIRARDNVRETKNELQRQFQQLRQEQITAEITELSVGRLAAIRSAT